MTSIAINAISIKEGGSLVVLENLLREMVSARPTWKWHVAINEDGRARLPDIDRVTFQVWPAHRLAGRRVRIWYETELVDMIGRVNADLLFSQTNYLPSRKLQCPSLLLVQNAGHFSEIFKRLLCRNAPGLLSRAGWRMKTVWVKQSVRCADSVTVQTAALAKAIVRDSGIAPERVSVIPHGSGLARRRVEAVRLPSGSAPVRIGYLTKPGVQKNFEVLFRAVEITSARGKSVQLVLTLGGADSLSAAVMGAVRDLAVSGLIENHPERTPAEMDDLYGSLHLFVFPSLCESFGFPMVEAMAHGLPLLVADTESNREVAGEAGIAFGPSDAFELADRICELIDDPVRHRVAGRASVEQAQEYSWQRTSIALVGEMERLIGGSR